MENKKFIAFFDYLGFSDFIEKNSLKEQAKILGQTFVMLERSISHGKVKDAPWGVVADMDDSNINVLNFSDTIVLWTNDDAVESLQELLRVVSEFNNYCNLYIFPIRGAIVYGEIIHLDHRRKTSNGGSYNINSVFGKGIVEAYKKSESQDWAGGVIDKSVIDYLEAKGVDPRIIFDDFAIKYKIPYKHQQEETEEYALRLVKGALNKEAFKNASKHIETVFAAHNKDISDERVQNKIQNTIKFLEVVVK